MQYTRVLTREQKSLRYPVRKLCGLQPPFTGSAGKENNSYLCLVFANERNKNIFHCWPQVIHHNIPSVKRKQFRLYDSVWMKITLYLVSSTSQFHSPFYVLTGPGNITRVHSCVGLHISDCVERNIG
jgi:hypothetical protein